MGHWRSIGQLGIKELRSLLRDPIMLFLIIWSFTFSIYSGAKSMNVDLHNAPIAVVDEDRSPMTQRILSAFYKPYFKKPEIISLAQVDPGMDSGRYTFVLDIPPAFERDVLAGREPKIQMNVDATQMGQASIGTSYIQNIVTDEIAGYVRGHRAGSAPAPIELSMRYLFNPTLTAVWFGAVAQLISQITMLAVILTGAALIREREHGTLEHLLVLPLTPFDIMMAKVWANGLVVLTASTFSLWFVIKGLLAMPMAGSMTLFILGTGLYLFSATSLGILLGTIARTMPQLGLLMMLVIMPLQMLSGGSTPFESMPPMIQRVMMLAPTTHFTSFAQAILGRGAGWPVIWPSFLAIIVIGAAFFFGALALFRRSLASGT